MHPTSINRLVSVVLAAFVASVTPVVLSAQAGGTGRIAGRVTVAEGTEGLNGVLVAVLGTGIGVQTDENGNFVLARVEAGAQTLRFTYLGRRPETREVNVVSGQSSRIDVTLSVVALSPVVIEAVRARGQAEALSKQQNAPNIMSIVAADQMGRFPDASAPDAVQRLPGVAIERDQGEGRYIKIRGASPAHTQITVNGEQVPSPEGEARQIALDAVPVGVLEAIEVSKAITPNMDADAIGGTVNLVTKRAPEGRIVSLETSGGYNTIRDGYTGLASFTAGGRSADSRLGGIFSGSFSRRDFGSDGIEPDYDIGDSRGEDQLAELDVRNYSLWRSRLGLTGSLDYRLGVGSTLFLSGIYSALTDQEQRRRLTHAIEDGEIAYAHKNRKEILSTFNVLAGGEHLMRKGARVDYRLSLTTSKEDTPFDDEVFFLTEDVPFAPSLSDPDRPQPNAGSAINGPYLFDEASPATSLTKNRDLTAGLNIALPFALGTSGSATFTFGVKARDKRKEQSANALEFELGDNAQDIELGRELGKSFSNNGFNPGRYPIPFTTAPSEIHRFISVFRSRLSDGEEDLEEQTNNYLLRERVFAGYAMMEFNPSQSLMILPGIRFERTELDTDGFSFDGDTEVLTPTSASNSYGNLFPMVHVRLGVDDRTNIRAAFTTAIFRPNFFDLVPYRIRDDEDLAIGNPELEASTSRNFDLLFERYDDNIGLVSGGLFYKSLSKPIFLTTSDNSDGGETEQPRNARNGRIVGAEVALQKRLTFLPGALSGLGLYANYTWTDSKATQPNGRESRIAGQADHVTNLALSYEYRRFSGQVSLNYTGSSILELGEDPEDDVFIDTRTQVDLQATYFLTRSTQVFLEAVNLTNQEYRTYVLTRSRPRQSEYYEPSFQLGLRWHP